MSCDTFKTILMLQYAEGKDICIPLSDSFGQETPFTLKIYSSFQMIPLNVWLIFIQLLSLEHLKDPWAIYFF